MRWNTNSPRPTKLKPRRDKIEMPEGFLKAWSNPEMTLSDICVEFGFCLAELRKVARQHSLPKRPATPMHIKVASKVLPTEDEIAERAEKIRNGWTDQVRESRWMGRRRVEFSLPQIESSEITLG